jgi:hypothetical protein
MFRRYSLRVFVTATILAGAALGYGIRWWLTPFCSQAFYANGQVSAEVWQRRTILGSIEVLDDRPHVRYYSNGVKSYEGFPRDPESGRYFGPDGKPISHADWCDYYARDLGNGTFAASYPFGDGGLRPLAKEFSRPPSSR